MVVPPRSSSPTPPPPPGSSSSSAHSRKKSLSKTASSSLDSLQYESHAVTKGASAKEEEEEDANNKKFRHQWCKNKNSGKRTKRRSKMMSSLFSSFPLMSSTRLSVLLILCLQNSAFTVLRRYSQGVLKETYSKHEVLLFGEVVKMIFSAMVISKSLEKTTPTQDSANNRTTKTTTETTISKHLVYLTKKSGKMFFLALMYGLMNILSFVALRNISAGLFTIFAQCKILTTATFSALMLRRSYSWSRWRALIALMLGVLLFSEPIWNRTEDHDGGSNKTEEGTNPILGTVAVLIEVTLSGFASIYFEKVIKTDPEQMNIWERNFQLALGSAPIYVAFILYNGGGKVGYGGGWSFVAFVLALLGAAGGLLVALSIKYGDSILKTLATTGAIILSSVLDHFWLGGPLTPVMVIAGGQVIIAICNYTFDPTPVTTLDSKGNPEQNAPKKTDVHEEEMQQLMEEGREESGERN